MYVFVLPMQNLTCVSFIHTLRRWQEKHRPGKSTSHEIEKGRKLVPVVVVVVVVGNKVIYSLLYTPAILIRAPTYFLLL